MNILRSILIGLASFICLVAISGMVYLFTLQATIMNPAIVKDWLRQSGVYNGSLISALVPTDQQGSRQPSDTSQAITATPSQVKTALDNTFTPSFIQAQVEGVIDNAYNWIDGKSSSFSFSIPIDQKRDTLIQQLAATIEPQIAALPVCSPNQLASGTTCRPSNQTPAQIATALTTQNIQPSSIFSKPITNQTFEKNNQSSGKQSLITQLPSLRALADKLTILLPIVTIITMAIIVIATTTGQRLRTVSQLSKRIFLSIIFTFIAAVALAWATTTSDLGLSSIAGQASELLVPLIRTILGGMARTLALYSGIVCLLSLAVWIGLSIWERKRPQAVNPQPVISQTSDPVPTEQA